MIKKTFKGQIPMGEQEKIHLSTADGLTGYRIVKFQVISKKPGQQNLEMIGQIFTTDQTNKISNEVDFSNADLLAVCYHAEGHDNDKIFNQFVIFDGEIINQDIFINITDPTGSTVPGNFYIELEQIKLNSNQSTFITLKNIRSKTQNMV